MKILEVIKACDRLFPNEFVFKEKIMWCDELGALLMREHMAEFDIRTIPPSSEGVYIIPEDIDFLDIDRIISDGKIIRKKDGRWQGMTYLSTAKGSDAVPVRIENSQNTEEMQIVYRKSYQKIRDTEIHSINITLNDTKLLMNRCPFKENDVIEVETIKTKFIAKITGIEVDSSLRYTVTLDKNTELSGSFIADIKRIITDNTVCCAPFDAMYIDFINAKICFYQRDYNSYNAHMSAFNSRLADFDLYMAKALPRSPDTKLRNWW